MPNVAAVAGFLEEFAPAYLAEEWDNVGLLVGHRTQGVTKLMTCLTVTPASAAEAVEAGANLIVTHHPLPFVAAKRLTADTTAGRLILDLIAARIAIYSPHTAFDSTFEGINHRLATGLGLRGIMALVPHVDGQGSGRWGWLPEALSLRDVAQRLKKFLSLERLQMVGRQEHPVRMVAVACGAADSLFDAAQQIGCDAMVLGEARFHTCLEAEAAGMGLLLPGHFASERFAVEALADVLRRRFPEVQIWASRHERDPMGWG
jgi:dinuclear metal center YbgI/SA1388 family protein